MLRVNADLDNFIHAASHDLLAPLGNIETSINIMNRVALSGAKLNDFLNIINTSVKKFRALITDISTIAKVEADMAMMEMVNMDEIVNNVEWSLEDKIMLSGAVISRNLAVKQVRFSKKNMRSIVYNLVSNAIKFNRGKSPVILINTIKEGDQVVLAVQDNGEGIPKEDINKIFNMYGRLNHAVEGHGIGLYLTQKIVNAAGGNIVVQSEPGVGTTFLIYLKVETGPPAAIPILN